MTDLFALGRFGDLDAELFDLIAEYERREARANESGIDDEERARRCDHAYEVRDRIEKICPATLRGVLAVLDWGSEIYDPSFWPDEAVAGLPEIIGRAKGEAPATVEQLAALEFEPLIAEASARMYHDFSADPWASECADHGIALRFAYAIMKQTKEELVETTEQIETDFPPPQPSPTAQLCETLKHSRERLAQLVGILETAEARQISAAAVVELRMMAQAGDGDDHPEAQP